jgi:hypothetical protein
VAGSSEESLNFVESVVSMSHACGMCVSAGVSSLDVTRLWNVCQCCCAFAFVVGGFYGLNATVSVES